MDETQAQQVRRSSRFATGIRGVVHTGGVDYPAGAHNLSRSGVLLVTEAPVDPGGDLEVTLCAPIGHLDLRVRARAIRIEADPDGGGTRLALEFRDLSDGQRAALEALVRRILEFHAPLPLEDLRPDASPQEVRGALERIPLAHRVSLAVKAKPRERERLMHDTHPEVLLALVRNPGLLPPEAHKLAQSRLLPPRAIELLAADPRWKHDAELRILLASHAKCPVPLADKLLSGLGNVALRSALRRPGLSEPMRNRILRRLARDPAGKK